MFSTEALEAMEKKAGERKGYIEQIQRLTTDVHHEMWWCAEPKSDAIRPVRQGWCWQPPEKE